MRRLLNLCVALAIMQVVPASAGGLLGDIVDVFVPGAGDKLDELHDNVKKIIPGYEAAEEGASAIVRKGTEEFVGETAGPALAIWIRESKRDAESAGVSPIPARIQALLRGYPGFDQEFLRRVRYRSGWGNEFALPALSFRFGDAAAITLDNVIMFRDDRDAQGNVTLWAHELTHVQQYRRWGIENFAKRYVKDHHAVEFEAEDNASRFAVWARINKRSFSLYDEAGNQLASESAAVAGVAEGAGQGQLGQELKRGNADLDRKVRFCRTYRGACHLPRPGGLVGEACYCNTPNATIIGSVVR